MNAQKKEQYHNIGLLLLRITIGTLIIFHGIANMSSDYAFIKQVLQGYHIPSFVAYGVFCWGNYCSYFDHHRRKSQRQ
ncbi:DoxX family protein [Kordia sp.]|uniref:DoxX family protein n=1 Tax=Kordia sp. TaxID=1965332 RepID=UPI0025BD82A4|nr:DoxX family protein [Kordia sp.]MCH2195392.1 hypothetical protein [Kordia sp.]